jgi:hypothetical protein
MVSGCAVAMIGGAAAASVIMTHIYSMKLYIVIDNQISLTSQLQPPPVAARN